MADQNASVNFTANTDQYTQALNAAISITDQYSKAADTALGTVAKMGGGLANKWVQSTAAITQVNKTATAQAAAYQTKLTAIETTSKVLGDKSFPKLEKSVKSLAKEFPIGIDKAVEQYKSLQESGVTLDKQVQKLAISYTKLGAVTNTSGPDIGKQMTSFTRSMGNSLDTVDAMGDSLTMLTKKFGGTAGGVLAFSKSIAPIASTVGMSQTHVMGLSTAFARLDEDGMAAGNAINKMLLDMSHSVREGSPEIRAYAEALNMTVDQTKEMFKNDPTEMIVRFTEQLNKQGPQAIRTLEGLGLEGVRTAKSLTALASQGNLRDIIEESTKAYNSGAMTAGAETAMGGVNDEMTKLNETMSQMVADSGKPFLNIMTKVLQQANGIAGVFGDIVSSPVGQAAGAGVTMAGSAVGTVMSAVSTASMLGLGIRGIRGVRGMGQGLIAGAQSGIAQNMIAAGGDLRGMSPEQAARIYERSQGRLGQFAQRQAMAGGWMNQALLMGGPSGMGFGARARDLAMGGVRTGRSLATLGMLVTASDMKTAVGGQAITTEQGQQMKREAQAMLNTYRQTGSMSKAMAEMGPTLKAFQQNAKDGSLAFGGLTAATKEVTKATVGVYGRSLGMAGKGLLSLAGMGMGPTVGAGVLVGGAALYARQQVKQESEYAREKLKEGSADPFKTFNEFAEKAGYATKAITSLGQAAEESAKSIIAGENKTLEEALKVSDKELQLSKSSGYEAAFESSGNIPEDVRKAILMNPGMSNEEIGRIVTDVASTSGQDTANEFGKALGAELPKYQTDPVAYANEVIKQTVGETSSTRAWSIEHGYTHAPGEGQAETLGLVNQNLKQIYQANVEKGGAEYAERKKLEDLDKIYTDAMKSGDKVQQAYAANILEEQTGLKASKFRTSMEGGVSWKEGALPYALQNAPDTGAAKQTAESYESWKAGKGVDTSKPADIARDEMAKADKRFGDMTGATINLTDVMSEANDLAKKNHTITEDLTEQQKALLSPLGKAIQASQAAPEDVIKARQAGAGVAQEALNQINKQGGSPEQARMALVQQLATAPANMKQIYGAALSELSMNPEAMTTQIQRSPLESIRVRMETANAYRAGGMPDASDATAMQEYNNALSDGAAAYQEYGAMMMQTVKQVRDSLKAMGRAEDDFARSQAHNRAQFNRQRKWAAQDFAHNQALMERNYQQSTQWAEEDYLKQRSRAQRDYQISTKRANEDYQKSVQRSQEDFRTSMKRADEDYLKSRARAQADHDKQLKRQIEDTAKSMYDPYQRVTHERVWSTRSLIGNMAQQQKVLQKQLAQLDKLREMGVSQEAIDVLGLADPAKAQQLFKVYADTLTDPTLIQQLNQTVEQRMGTAQGVMEESQSYRRGEEDFAESMKRMDEDYRQQIARSTEDFLLNQKRQHEDFVQQMKRGQEDFNKAMSDMAADYQTQMSRSKTQYDQQMAEIEFQYNQQRKRQKISFDSDMAYAASQFAIQQGRVAADLTSTLEDMVTGYSSLKTQAATLMAKLPADLRVPLQTAMDTATTYVDDELAKHKFTVPEITVDVKLNVQTKDITWPANPPPGWAMGTGTGGGGGAGGEPGSAAGGGNEALAKFFLDRIGDTRMIGKGAGQGVSWHSVLNACLKNVSWAKRYLGGNVKHSGYPTAASVGYALRKEDALHGGYDAPAGALYWWNASIGGGAGHVAVADGKGNAINNWGSNRVEKHKASGMASRAYLGWSSYSALATGGIVKRRLFTHLGEGGFPEAVLPLNERGADFVSKVLARYLPNDEAREAKVAPYASKVTINNYSYDQSTKVNGPITIQSNDPNDMARQLAAKQRRDRLRQPVRSAG